MGDVIVIEKQNQEVVVVYPVKNAPIEDIYAKTVVELGLVGQPYSIIDSATLPQNLKYRKSWRLDNGAVTEDATVKSQIDASQPLFTKPEGYDSSKFLTSCMTDSSIVAVMDKMDAKQESRVLACLQSGNFGLFNALVNGYIQAEVVTQADYDLFASKLQSEQGVDITEITL